MTSRRIFLGDLARYAALAAGTPSAWRLTWRPRFADDPFLLGVASGDPTPEGGILWTRLAPSPLEPEGGMNGLRTVVRWQVAADDAFRQLVQEGQVTAAPELAYSVHVDVQGLAPNRWYFYRFQSGDAVSPVGRLRTTPAAGDAAAPLRFAFASCQHYEHGFFTAYQHLAREELDLVAHLGDYIYEYGAAPGRARQHVGLEVRTLDDYRRRYALYKADEHLRAAHARCPWVVTWDDHEVDNNYAGLHGENDWESEAQMRARRAAAYQAWWEHQPVRLGARVADWADLRIHRDTRWGGLAHVWTLDTRQYRSDQACGDGGRVIPCGDWDAPTRTMLGAAQERWLLDGIAASRARWQVLAQQVVMAPEDERPKAGDTVYMDSWLGYPRARDRLLAGLAQRAAGRTVVLTGDIHNNWVYDIRRGFDVAQRPVIATEFVGTSITSGGDGSERASQVTDAFLAARPSLKWHNNRRGYVVCEVTAGEWRTHYRTVEYVSRPGAPVVTATSWRLAHGRPGVERA